MGKYVISYVIYWIGKILKGQASILVIQTIVAYSMLPRLLRLPIMLFLELTGKYNQLADFESYLITGLYFIISLWILKIATQGLIRFNNYGITKAIINQSPFIIFSLTIYFFAFLK